MNQERIICFPLYKILYAAMFVVLLALVRGISGAGEISITLDVYMGLLALVFCADTYEIEHRGKRWEVFKLLPGKSRVKTVYRRLMLQLGFLFVVAVAGYGLFYWQRPMEEPGISSMELFLWYLPAVAVSMCFWALVSMTFVNGLKNFWAGIGCALPLWLLCNSAQGDALFGKYNVFAFSFRLLENDCGFCWVWGKAAALVITVVLLLAVPPMLKRKGW